MTPTLARLLTSLYPRRWKARYSAEFQELLQDLRPAPRMAIDIIRSALTEHVVPTQEGTMNPQPGTFRSTLKHPSALLPLAMSVMALALLLCTFLIYGVSHDPDEGAVAHLWQILMAGQLPIIAFFAIRWLPRAPKQTLGVLALQAAAGAASCAPVFLLGL